MATIASFLSSSLPLPLLLSSPGHSRNRHRYSASFPLSPPFRATIVASPRKILLIPILALASNSDFSFDEFGSNQSSSSADKKSVLLELIQEIEPLDVSLIQRDVPPTTLDAMKRTISGMLGLLPSDRFQVFIGALWEPLSRLLVSSMMTGYTLRNAEYRLCLERNLDIHEGNVGKQELEDCKLNLQGTAAESAKANEFSEKNVIFEKVEEPLDDIDVQGLGEISPAAQQYILQLQSRIAAVKKELHEVKRKSAALQMQQFVGEEKNDLLDYLRSLEPEKVAELSEPTCPELKETIHSVVHGLLATLSPRMQSKAPPWSENSSTGALNIGSGDCAELVENTSLHFQPLISLSRDYLARSLFWCMLVGHYLRGLEYRMELTDLLSLTNDLENDDAWGDEQAV